MVSSSLEYETSNFNIETKKHKTERVIINSKSNNNNNIFCEISQVGSGTLSLPQGDSNY